MERKWHQRTWAIILLLWLFFPVGLYLMWRHASWGGRWKWGVTGIVAAFVALLALGMALPDEDPLAGLTPEQVVSVHATATQEALADQEEETQVTGLAALAGLSDEELAALVEPNDTDTDNAGGLTAEECDYLGLVGYGLVLGGGEALIALGDLFDAAGVDPGLIYDATWRDQVWGNAGRLTDAPEALYRTTPPQSLTHLHEKIMATFNAAKPIGVVVEQVVDSLDPVAWDQAMAQIDMPSVARATDEMNLLFEPYMARYNSECSG